MNSLAQVLVHPSQFPEGVRRDLLGSLRARRINHKFHYDSVKQAQQWLALHRAWSPSRTDPDVAAIYERGFQAAARRLPPGRVHLIGLGCGGGQKDSRLLQRLSVGRDLLYSPVDVSVALVLVARGVAAQVIGPGRCVPLVCDLATAADLAQVFDELGRSCERSPAALVSPRPGERGRGEGEFQRETAESGPTPSAAAVRLFTCFGLLPNFEPGELAPRLAAWLRPGEFLVLSANLAPGPDYAAGMLRILPQYDNDLTRRWLMSFLLDLGVEPHDGELKFAIEDGDAEFGLKRVAADFQFHSARSFELEAETFRFGPGDSVRLFYSYRHTTCLVRRLLGCCGLEVLDQWVSASGEEAVFLCQRAGGA
jgi:SAM-dependent methyltransferase